MALDKDLTIDTIPAVDLGEEGIFDVTLHKPLLLFKGDSVAYDRTIRISDYELEDGEEGEIISIPTEVEILFWVSRQGGKWKKAWRYGKLVKCGEDVSTNDQVI